MFDGTIISVQLQLILIVGCLFTYWYIIRKVKKSNVRIDDIIVWMIGIFILFIFCLFPQLPAKLSYWIGFEASVNSIFFMVIFFLFIMVFLLTVKVSQLQEKIKDLTHQVALQTFKDEKKD